MENRAFVIAAFGDRQENVQRLVKNIRSFVDYPIHIITTKDSEVYLYLCESGLPEKNISIECVERIWSKGSYREGQRNSNYFKIKFAIDHHYDSLCLLDDDMFIMNGNFVDGFAIADRFGVAVPVNPRVFQKYNVMGADVHQKDLDEIKDLPQFMTACNYSPFFVNPHVGYTTNFLHRLLWELEFNTCRITLAIWKASWHSQFTPVYLPEQWCVCGGNAEFIKNYKRDLRGQERHIEPIMIHLGHEQVRRAFVNQWE